MDEKAYVFQAPLAKVGASVGSAAAVNADRIVDAAAGVTTHPLLQMTWPNIAAFAAAMVSLCVLWDWWWKRFWRPFLERKGWLKPKPVPQLTAKEWRMVLAVRASATGDSDMHAPESKL
jgi:hypothetical protein